MKTLRPWSCHTTGVWATDLEHTSLPLSGPQGALGQYMGAAGVRLKNHDKAKHRDEEYDRVNLRPCCLR